MTAALLGLALMSPAATPADFTQPVIFEQALASEKTAPQNKTNLVEAAEAGEVKLELLEIKNLPGSFTSQDQIATDTRNIYLVSNQGQLFVLANDGSAGFPLRQTINISPAALTAVAVDSENIYIASAGGELYIYNKSSLTQTSVLPLSSYGLSDVKIFGGRVYAARGQAEIAVAQNFLALSALNPGDEAVEILPNQNFALGQTYGAEFEADQTVVFSRSNGEKIISLPNPKDFFGNFAQPELNFHPTLLTMSVPGCCGTGVTGYSLPNFQTIDMPSLAYANTFVSERNFAVTGHEDGYVKLLGQLQQASDIQAEINLPVITGFTNPEDIEIRAVAIAGSYIVAASSWGNDQSRGENLPSVFIIKVN